MNRGPFFSLCVLSLGLFSTFQAEGVSVCPTREIQATAGVVTSPNHPSNYPADEDCTLTIDARQNVLFKIQFEALSIEEDDDGACSYDSLTIIDGSKRTDFCGSAIPLDYTSKGNKILLKFLSDSSYELAGFKLSFSTVEGPKAPNGSSICPTREIKVTVDSPEKLKGALYSPGFPNYYPPNQNCTVTLDVPDNFKTIVWFQSFFLQYHERCEYDKLVISDELGGNTQCGGRQDTVPAPMELRGRKVQLAFTTNEDSSASGFYLKYNITKIRQGRCVCTPGLSYISINNYQPRNDRTRDDVRFEFKSTQSSGMIMFLKGRYRDSLYVAYENSRVFIVRIDLGTGQARMEPATLTLNDNAWHKVHITRDGRNVRLNIDNGAVDINERTPGGFNRLDLPSPVAYFLGSPTNLNLLPNFNGCIRDFSVDGYEPLTNAWIAKPDYTVVRKLAMRQCSSAD